MFRRLLIILAASFILGACAKKQIIKPQAEIPPAPEVKEAPLEEPSVRYPDWEAIPQLKVIYFDYDSSDLTITARNLLKANADYLKSNANLNVLIEGHCDERGTTEYNLALGQRRAAIVREYYGQLGVPLGQIGTISYGEERPVDPAHTEQAWAKNRRVETKVRGK